ncbi:MAG: vitamin K epoxide reductase family protein, partial [Patescibacteria group bacterium]
MTILFKLLLIFCSLGGFFLSFYIYHKKHRHEKMMCPIGGKCATVMASEYARFFGIPLEIIGIAYYGFIFVAYMTLFLGADGGYSLIPFLLFGLTITALLFSAYLTFIQAFTIKQWCTLCLASAGFCTVIFTSALITSERSFISLLVDYQPLMSAWYLLALAVGLGTATVTDIFGGVISEPRKI